MVGHGKPNGAVPANASINYIRNTRLQRREDVLLKLVTDDLTDTSRGLGLIYLGLPCRSIQTSRNDVLPALYSSGLKSFTTINMDIIAFTESEILQQILSTRSSRTQLVEPQLWDLVDNIFPQANSDFQFWWRATGIPLAVLLENAGYAIDSRCQYLLFYYCYVVPELGARSDAQGLPRYWKSFMTDHFSPIEMSWEWGCGGENPTIRFSIEPIGPYAGTPADPLNQYAIARLVHQYQRQLPNCDLRLFEHFSRELLSYSHSSSGSQGHGSRTFIAVDFGEDIMLKAYFLPTFKAAELRQSSWTVISQAIQNLPDYSPSSFPGLSVLQKFLIESPQGSGLEAEILAIDCVAPATSRLKVYMRSHSTNFDSVRGVMRLGGVLDEPSLDHGLEELWELWKNVLPLGQKFSSAEDLPNLDHRTAGVLYYFDTRQGKPLPGVKVYLPVRHYAQNDLAIAEGLRAYLESRGQGCLAYQYLEALKKISPVSSPMWCTDISWVLNCQRGAEADVLHRARNL